MNGQLAAADKNPLSELRNPAATQQETTAFAKYRSNPKASREFIATRQYIRQLKASPEVPPPVPDSVQLKYALNFSEQLDLYNAMLFWGVDRGDLT
ncbi:MAG: hypothetical protein PHU21_05140 [Elusimicrobia bacterium]|nr:hypothetical protein [Elusimicrobiota bacterium]